MVDLNKSTAGRDLIEEAIIISWQWRAEDLNCRILDLAASLDAENLEKLSQGFPNHVSALRRFRQEAGWFGKIDARIQST